MGAAPEFDFATEQEAHVAELNALRSPTGYSRDRVRDIARQYHASTCRALVLAEVLDLQRALRSAQDRFGLSDDPDVIAAWDYLATRRDPLGW